MSDALELTCVRDGSVNVSLHGQAIGCFTKRHVVARNLADGQTLLHASINSISPDGDGYRATVRIITGSAGNAYVMPDPIVREYSVRVAGVSYRQDAVKGCRFGDVVDFEHDEANEHDPRAIAVLVRGEQIGYLPKDGWLTDYLLDQGGRANAVIDLIAQGPTGDLGVVLAIKLG